MPAYVQVCAVLAASGFFSRRRVCVVGEAATQTPLCLNLRVKLVCRSSGATLTLGLERFKSAFLKKNNFSLMFGIFDTGLQLIAFYILFLFVRMRWASCLSSRPLSCFHPLLWYQPCLCWQGVLVRPLRPCTSRLPPSSSSLAPTSPTRPSDTTTTLARTRSRSLCSLSALMALGRPPDR